VTSFHQDLLVVATKAKLFQIDKYHKYRVQLRNDVSHVSSALSSPNPSVFKLQYFEPMEKRIEPDWEENEGRA
jgi:hypothetical protein